LAGDTTLCGIWPDEALLLRYSKSPHATNGGNAFALLAKVFFQQFLPSLFKKKNRGLRPIFKKF
jgi:hypothetical protein